MDTSINILIPYAPYLFGSILTVGVVYIVAIMFLGGVAETGLDIDADIDIGVDADVGGLDADASSGDAGGESIGISLNVIAAFCVGLGTMGLIAALNDWSVLLTLLSSLLFGAFLGRFFQVAMNFVLRQQGGEVITSSSLIGISARITVNTPAGHYGEALIEEPERMKYAVKHIHDKPLAKGDIVVVINVEAGRLYVKKESE